MGDSQGIDPNGRRLTLIATTAESRTAEPSTIRSLAPRRRTDVPRVPIGQTTLARVQQRGDVGVVSADASAVYCLAAIVDVDNFVINRLTQGDEWASDLIACIEELLVRERERTIPSAGLFHLEPDEWILLVHGHTEREVRELGIALAEAVRRGVAEQTSATVTVSLGRAQEGQYRTERSMAEAVEANQRKLVLGGNRVILADDQPEAASTRPTPERIEQELAGLIREGDRDGALMLLKGWISDSANLEGVTPEVLRSWIGAAVLFSLDVVGQRRLSDGSMDWVEIFDQTQTSFDEITSIATIHEQSYLGLWLEQILPRSIQRDPGARAPKRHILALVEAYLHEHYAEDLSLAKVSRALFVSSFYISHLFHRQLNTTFLKYLTAIRISKARRLLLDTDAPIAAIAEEVGYGTTKSFRCVFKRATGVTPTEFRRSGTRAA